VKIVENIALGYLDNITTFGTLTGKGWNMALIHVLSVVPQSFYY